MQVALELSQAIAYHQRGAFEQARAHYEAAMRAQQDHPGVLHLFGMLAFQQERFKEAVQLLRRAAAVDPLNPDVHNHLGCALKGAKRWRQALACFDEAIRLSPGFAQAYSNRGNVLRLLKRLPQALDSLDRAVALAPQVAEAHLNRGAVLHDTDRLQDAMACYDQALLLDPRNPDIHFNRGTAFDRMGRFEEAVASFDRALALGPPRPQTVFSKSFALLALGDFERGWPLYEGRLDGPDAKRQARAMAHARWRGELPVQGRTLLLHAEQGMGDMIQMARFAPQVAALGARVILQVHRPLVGLMRQLPGVQQVVALGEPLPAADGLCSLYSLPAVLRVRPDSIPAPQGYLRADPVRVAAWAGRLGPRPVGGGDATASASGARRGLEGLRIGLAWSGNPLHPNDRHRSLRLSQLRAGLPQGPQYVSLQKEVRKDDRDALQAWPGLLHFGPELHDFEDAAALCEAMDLVISVDTSIAHLAGALGKPVWILLAFPAEWRWMVAREDTPWYASARLVRQDADCDWVRVFQRVGADLATLSHT